MFLHGDIRAPRQHLGRDAVDLSSVRREIRRQSLRTRLGDLHLSHVGPASVPHPRDTLRY